MKFTDRIKNTKFGALFLEQYSFKTLVLALVSLIISIAFAVFNLVLGILENSVWYGALAAYYITLIIFRSAVLVADRICRKKVKDEALLTAQTRIYLTSGIFLVITEIAMSAAVTQMIIFGLPENTGEIMAIASAAYAFTKIGLAIYNLIKAKKYADPVSRSLRCLNFADACMSMVSLTVVLLSTFGKEQEEGQTILYLKAFAGFLACALVLALATYIIITSIRKLKADKQDKLTD